MKKILFIINPVAGMKLIQTQAYEIINMFCNAGYECTVRITSASLNATDIVRESGMNKDIIVCSGGDGTFNEVVAGCVMLEIDTPLGYIPSGSTNDFANSLGLSNNMIKATRRILNGEEKTLDIGLFNNRVFTYIASFGAFTKASYSTSREMKNLFGHFAYVLSGVKELGDIRSYHMKINADGKQIEGDYIFGGVCNSRRIGGIVKLPEDVVDMNDGLLEAFFIKTPTKTNELAQLIFNLNSKNLECPMFEFFSTSKIEIVTEECIDWTIDGEHQEGSNKIIIENKKDAFKLLC